MADFIFKISPNIMLGSYLTARLGQFVKEWGSVNQIMRETGIPASTIFRVCSDRYPHEHSAKGYIWRYKDGKTENKNPQA